MDILEKISGEMQAQGQKMTKQRQAILKVLAGNEMPLTAEEIFLKVHAASANTSLATVYRNLKTLLALGIISREGILEDKALYRLQRREHAHNLICLGCRRVVSFQGCPLDDFAAAIGKQEGFQVTEHRMELYGYCPDCDRKRKHEDL